MIEKITTTIANNKNFLILSHKDPDGDSVGSLVAFNNLINSFEDKEAVCVCIDEIPDIYSFFSGIKKIKKTIPEKKYDVVVFLDIAVEHRLNNEFRSFLDKDFFTVNIDHHLSNSFFADVNYVEEDAASTTVLIYKLFKLLNAKMDQESVDAIFLGLMTDTGNFTFNTNRSETFKIAADLIDLGANVSFLKEKVYFSNPQRKIKLLTKIMQRIKIDSSSKIAWSYSRLSDWAKYKITSPDFEGIPEECNSIKDVNLFILFREEENGLIKMNLRSKGTVDSRIIANKYGGGGHFHASGARCFGELDKVMRLVTEEARQIFLNNE